MFVLIVKITNVQVSIVTSSAQRCAVSVRRLVDIDAFANQKFAHIQVTRSGRGPKRRYPS